MGKIEEHRRPVPFRHLLQPLGSSLIRGNALQERFVAHSRLPAGKPCGRNILQIVLPEHPDGRLPLEREASPSVLRPVGECAVRQPLHPFRRMRRHCPHMLIPLVINQRTAWLDALHESRKLLHIVLEGGEHIHMVPSNARQHGNVRMVVMELRAAVDGRGEVLVPLEHGDAALLAQSHHRVESCHLRPHHVIECHPARPEHMHNHRCRRRLPVAASHHDAPFPARLLVEILRVAVYPHAQFLCPQQFRIVLPRVHPQDDRVRLPRDFLREPPPRFGQQPGVLQPRPRWLEYLIVRPRHVITFLLEGERQVVHGSPADSDKMDVHGISFLIPHANIAFFSCISLPAAERCVPFPALLPRKRLPGSDIASCLPLPRLLLAGTLPCACCERATRLLGGCYRNAPR